MERFKAVQDVSAELVADEWFPPTFVTMSRDQHAEMAAAEGGELLGEPTITREPMVFSGAWGPAGEWLALEFAIRAGAAKPDAPATMYRYRFTYAARRGHLPPEEDGDAYTT